MSHNKCLCFFKCNSGIRHDCCISHGFSAVAAKASGPVDQPMPSRKCQGLRGPKKYSENKDHVNHVTILMFLLTLNCTRAFWSTINDSLISIPYPTLGATLQCLTLFLRMLSSAFSQTDLKTSDCCASQQCKILLIQKEV